jgi:importin-5
VFRECVHRESDAPIEASTISQIIDWTEKSRKKEKTIISGNAQALVILFHTMQTPPHSPGANQMSPPQSPANPQFTMFLQGLCSPDNNTRLAAEAQYNNLKGTNPGLLVTNLVSQLRGSSDPTLRGFSAILLRGLVGLRDPVYELLDVNTQTHLRSMLLQIALESSADHSLSKKVCDTIGELALVVQATSQWQELIPWIMNCVNTPDANICEVGLRTLSMVAMLFSDNAQYQSLFGQLLGLFQRCLTAPGAGIGVRGAAIAAVSNLVACIQKSEARAGFRPIVPFMLQGLAEVLTNDATTLKAAECLEWFCEIAYEHGSFFRTALNQVHAAMCQIAGTVQLDDKLRRLAVEWLCSCAESSGSMCRKLPNDSYTRDALPILMQMMYNDVEEMVGNLQEWESKADGNGVGTSMDDDDDIRNFDVAADAIKRLSASIGAKKFLPVFFELLGQYMQSSDWKHQFVSLVALAPVCEVAPIKYVKPIMQQIQPFFQSQDPRIRCVACDVFGELSLESVHGPMFQQEYHSVVVPLLQACLSDPQSARVQARAAAAFITFLECCEDEYIEQYLDGIVQVLFERLQKGKRTVQEQAVTALASVAECASRSFDEDEDEEESGGAPRSTHPFVKYYPHIMPVLKTILTNCDKKEERLFRARALECATLFGDAVPKETYVNDAKQLMQFMHHQQSQGLEYDHPLRSYMLQAYARIGRCLGRDFSQYLHMIMPSLIASASVKAEVVTIVDDTQGDRNNEDLSETAEQYKVNMGEGRVITVHTSALDEKTTAMQMLGTMAREMKELFAPYVEPVLNVAAPLMLFSGTCHDDLRACAVAVIPGLIDSVNAAGDKDKVRAMFNFTIKNLFQALSEEVEMDVVKTIAQSIKETILAACRPTGSTEESSDFSRSVPMLDENLLQATFQQLVVAMQGSLQRRAQRRAERVVAEDYDEDDAEMDELCNESEVELLYFLHECIGAVIRTHGSSFLPAFRQQVLPLMQQMGQQGAIESDQKIVVYIFDDVVEFGGEVVQRDLLPSILPAFLSAATPDTDCGLRQGAVYGIGVSASAGGQHFRPYVNQAAQVLMNCITNPEAYEGGNGAASDNAVSALGKLCDCHAEHFQSSRMLLEQQWLPRLPLLVDEEESITVTTHLCTMLANQQRTQLVLGPNYESLGRVIHILTTVITSDRRMGICNKALRVNIQTLLNQMKSQLPAQALQSAAAQLNSQQQQVLMQ